MVITEIKIYYNLNIFFAAKGGEALYSQQKQDQELTVAQIMNSLLPNSDLNWRKEGKPPEKAMAPHSSIHAWKIPWAEESGRLQSMGSLRVRHEWAISLSLFTFMHWRRKWQPTPVFLPGEFQGLGSLVGCHLWGRTESDTTEVT